MRLAVVAVCGLFLSATLLGCGGAAIPTPSPDAKPGPPPGTSDDLTKPPVDKKK